MALGYTYEWLWLWHWNTRASFTHHHLFGPLKVIFRVNSIKIKFMFKSTSALLIWTLVRRAFLHFITLVIISRRGNRDGIICAPQVLQLHMCYLYAHSSDKWIREKRSHKWNKKTHQRKKPSSLTTTTKEDVDQKCHSFVFLGHSY